MYRKNIIVNHFEGGGYISTKNAIGCIFGRYLSGHKLYGY